MSLSATVTRKYTTAGKTLGATDVTVTGGGSIQVEEPLLAATPDQEITIAIAFANMKMLAFESTVACTVQTNDATTGDDEFTLAANKPLGWDDSELGAIFLTADVTSLFVTVAGASAGTFKIVGIMDVTP